MVCGVALPVGGCCNTRLEAALYAPRMSALATGWQLWYPSLAYLLLPRSPRTVRPLSKMVTNHAILTPSGKHLGRADVR